MESSTRSKWDGDVLDRKQYGDFLHRYLVERYGATKDSTTEGALCFALDGDWGTGKSFFISKWAKDIENCQHPVVIFDAWKNDLSEDPLLGFVAALVEALKPWVEQRPIGERASDELTSAYKNAVGNIGRALVPTLKVIGKGVLKRATGIAADDLSDALSGNISANDSKPISGEASALTNEAMDKFFESSMAESSKHLAAIDSLKDSLGKLLRQLDEKSEANLPVFIIIDELDRCRPTYAIALLEGMKHLFDVNGLCFCVSTHLTQLSESLKAVYGSGFDARKYLRRFFNFEYTLPKAQDRQYAKKLARESLFLSRPAIVSGLSNVGTKDERTCDIVASVFSFVATGFNLDLRSQKQVFAIAEAACTGIAENAEVHLLYLFCLAALKNVDSDAFLKLADRNVVDQFLADAIQKRIDASCRHGFVLRGNRTEQKKKEISLYDMFSRYIKVSMMSVNAISEQVHQPNYNGDFAWVLEPLANEAQRTAGAGSNGRPSIWSYAVLVRQAGQLVSNN